MIAEFDGDQILGWIVIGFVGLVAFLLLAIVVEAIWMSVFSEKFKRFHGWLRTPWDFEREEEVES